MFNSCSELKSFSGALPSLTNGTGMFAGAHIEDFNSSLPALETGDEMFYGCRLTAQSVKQILNTIPTVTSSTIDLGIAGAPDESLTDEAATAWMNTQANQLAIACGYTNTQGLLDAFSAKGWTVNFIFTDGSGGYTATIYPKDGGPADGGITMTSLALDDEEKTETETKDYPTLPIYVKLVEVTEDGDGYTHTSLDGTKFYRLKYFHITNGSTEGYTKFNSIEEAIEYFNIKPATK